MTKQSAQTDLEIMLDAFGMEGVLRMLAEISNEKAEHVQTNWQDKALAREWTSTARKLETLANKL